MTNPNYKAYPNTPKQKLEHAITLALDALCDVALALPSESKTRMAAVSAEAVLRAAFDTPEDGNLDDEHRRRFGKAFTRAGKAEDLFEKSIVDPEDEDPAFVAGPLPTKDELLKVLIERLGFTIHEASSFGMPNSVAAHEALDSLSLAMTIGARHPHMIDRSYAGMSMRQYAAIKLKMPNSGTEWLDDMILASLRNDFAAKCAAALISSGEWSEIAKTTDLDPPEAIATNAFDAADAMLKVSSQYG